jgi:L-amino acid N-acyltransferase YncA
VDRLIIRPAEPGDAEAFAAIYAPHVLHGTATFEETPPDAVEMARRFGEVAAQGLPWLAAEADGAVFGYAYAGLFRTRSAYRVSVEDSIYIAREACGRGVGRRLLERLIALCAEQGRTTMAAVIGDSANTASIRLHEALGFTHAGVLKDMAFKHGRWLDVVFMQRELTRKP